MLDKIALTLLIIGGLNWGSIGIFQFDLVGFIGGGQTGVISRIIYIVVALAAIWCISLLLLSATDTRVQWKDKKFYSNKKDRLDRTGLISYIVVLNQRASTIAFVSLAMTISSSVAISSTRIFESAVVSVPCLPWIVALLTSLSSFTPRHSR